MRWLARSLARVIALSTVALLVGGCGLLPANQGDPSAPVLVRGRVTNATGAPVGGATIQVSVFDQRNAQIGQRIPMVYDAKFGAGADGSFVIHVAPTAPLIAAAAANGGYVNFMLLAISPDGSIVASWAFPRELTAGTWSDEVPVADLHPLAGS